MKGENKFSSTFYNQQRKKQNRTPPKPQTGLRRNQKSYDSKKKFTQNQNFQDIALHEKDQRFRYLLKHGQIKKIQKSGNIIFAQLPQIPNVWVCYRRPCERQANVQKLSLDSIQLTHIPLLQGEQKLKMLTFQHNKIGKIQNLISLPNLLYIDLYDNQIKQIENLSSQSLKVVLLPKNLITRIKGINQLVKLEVLDLHNNKISKIEGFSLLNSLRILNLSHNQIVKMQNLQNLTSLNQLNLKANSIATIQNVQKLQKLQKLYLANNKIQIKNMQTCELVKLNFLKQLSLEGNPYVAKQKSNYIKNIIKYLPNLKLLDGKTPNIEETQQKQSDQQSNHEQVLSLIASQWAQQKKRIIQIELNNGSKRQFLKNTCITGGHAQIEDENILFIYGNSYDVVLTNQTFQQTVQKIRFQYVFIQFLIQTNILNTLKKFKKLKIVQFRQTYILSLLQIAKLQNLPNLKIINIESAGNPISSCTFLKQFVIYRFPGIIQINKQDIKQQDRSKAKALFQNFDKVLQIPQKMFGPDAMRIYPSQDVNAKKDKNYMKSFNKILGETSQKIMQNISQKSENTILVRQSLQKIFDLAMLQLIKKQKYNHSP